MSTDLFPFLPFPLFSLRQILRPEEVTERRSIGGERERGKRGSGLTRRSSQGWIRDQILSLIWRRFTQKSPFSLSYHPLSTTFPSRSRRLIIPASFPRRFHRTLLLYIPFPSFSLSVFFLPFFLLRTLLHRSRDRSVKPHTLGIEYIKVPSFFLLRLYHALFRLSVSLFFSLSLSIYLSGTLLPSIAGR